MARGQQKIQSQQRNAKKKSETKTLSDNKLSAAKALIHQCPVCRTQMPDLKTFKQHFENKHPKNSLPEELVAVTY